jgi:hypothetical protein
MWSVLAMVALGELRESGVVIRQHPGKDQYSGGVIQPELAKLGAAVDALHTCLDRYPYDWWSIRRSMVSQFVRVHPLSADTLRRMGVKCVPLPGYGSELPLCQCSD